MRRSSGIFVLGFAVLSACSASGTDDQTHLGTAGTGGTAPLVPGTGGLSLGGATMATSLSAHVERDRVKVDIVTVSCPGQCADVVAVATGGKSPYAFTWDDGSTSAERRICPSDVRTYEVTVEDAGVIGGEFPRPPQTAKAAVTSNVLATCSVPDAGPVVPPPMTGCAPFRLLAAVPSGFGIAGPPLAGYTADGGGQIIAVSQAVLPRTSLDAQCPRLFLAGDSAGTQPIGFDNNLLLELRAAPDAPIEKRWYYGGGVISFGGQALVPPSPPTVSGFALGIPNFLPFGYDPLAVDLATALAGYPTFHLTATVVDSGAFGSNTEIWVIPR